MDMQATETVRAIQQARDEISRAVIIKDNVLTTVLSGLFAHGHVLLEDVPGTGKTLTARSVADVLGLSFNRIQFTPDLLPADVTGTEIYDERHNRFEFNDGPLFANIVLADELNRASPKTQSALLEAMEERQVTVAGETHPLPRPFFVIATQNSVESGEGTFPLPEAQLDRFIVKTSIGYPSAADELELLDRRDDRTSRTPSVEQVVSAQTVTGVQETVESIECQEDVKWYIVDIVHATREDPRIAVGVSPRGCQRLFEVARAHAVVDGREYLTPHDVKTMAIPALAHRIKLTPDARVENVTKIEVIESILEQISTPTLTRATPA